MIQNSLCLAWRGYYPLPGEILEAAIAALSIRLRELHDSGTYETFYPDGRPLEIDQWPLIRSIRDGQEVRNEDILHLPAQDSQFTLRCNSSPIYDDEGHLVAGVAVFYDVTAQLQTEEALRGSKEEPTAILERITDAFYAVDREWHYTYINERALPGIQRALGQELTREEILGKNVWEMFPGHVSSVFYEKLHEAMREQKVVEFEAHSPVTARWVETHASPSEEGLSLMYRDITERKQAEEEIETRTRQQATVAELGLRALGRWRLMTSKPSWMRPSP